MIPRLLLTLMLMAVPTSLQAHEAHEAQDSMRLPVIGPAPSFALVSQDGAPVTLAALRGKIVAVSFIYTACPDICPLLTQKMVQVQDGGLPLNRLTMESQLNGGMIQSLGMALWEGRVMDAELGLQLNPGFGDYKLPGSLEMPEFVPIIDDDDKREVVIGIAEACIIPSLGALANAVYNACGVRVRELPITPDKILMGLMGERRSA